MVDEAVSQPRFSTASSLERHFLPALFYERDEGRRQYDLVYGAGLTFPAVFDTLDPNMRTYYVHVKIKHPSFQGRQEVVIPPANCRVTINVKVSDMEKVATGFEGVVLTTTKDRFDFSA